MESLQKFLHALERSAATNVVRSKDLALRMKGWAFKGYLLSTLKEKKSQYKYKAKNRTAVKEIVNSFQNSIDLYSSHFTGAKVYESIMYFVFIQQSRSLEDLGMLKDALNRSLEAMKLSCTDNEEASALSQMGGVYLQLGEATEALKAYEKSIQLKAYDLSLYRKIVECHIFLDDLSKNKWKKLMFQIQSKIEHYESHDYHDEAEDGNRYRVVEADGGLVYDDSILNSEVDGSDVFGDPRFPSRNDKSYIFSAKLSLNHTEFIHGTTAVYYAMFATAEKAALYEDAWYYLNLYKNMTIDLKAESGAPFDENMKQEYAQTQFVMDTFTPGFFPDNKSHGISSRVPIFIVGMMRSGSTLLESMLYAHPDIYTVGEESIFVDEVNTMITKIPALKKTFSPIDSENSENIEYTNEERDIVSNAVDNRMANKEIKEEKLQELIDEFGEVRSLGVDTVGREDDFKDAETIDFQFDVNKVINRHAKLAVDKMISTAQDMHRYSSKYVHDRDANRAPKYVIDKMLLNHMNLGFIHLMYPNALIINIMRDPLDTLLSCFRCNFGSSWLSWTLTIPTLYRGYQRYMDVMAHYRGILPKKRIYEVQYEKLLKNPEKIIRDILKKLNLPWDPAVLRYHDINRTVQTSSALQVKKRISKSTVGFWKVYKPQLRHLAGALNKLIDRLSEEEELPFENSMNWDLDEDFEYFHDDGN